MAAPRGRGGPKKDKWKSKTWYNVMAPDMFNRAKISETLADDPDKLIGRVVDVTVQDITGDFSKMHIKVSFKIIDVRGINAYTTFVGHDMTSDYVRRMTRRKRTKTDLIVDVYTRDKFLMRIKPIVISERRIKSSQQTAIRQKVYDVIKKYVQTKSINEVINGIISGQMGREAANACKIIQPLQRVEIRKTEILKQGDIVHVYEDEHESEEEGQPPVEEAKVSAEPEEKKTSTPKPKAKAPAKEKVADEPKDVEPAKEPEDEKAETDSE